MSATPTRTQPRLSASQLADYLVAPTPIGQLGILRQAKNPGHNKPLIIQYQHARKCIAACLQAPFDSGRIIAATLESLEQKRTDPSSSALIRDDAERSIAVINTFQRTQNALDIGGARYYAPPKPSHSLNISGVEISVFPDVISSFLDKKGTRVGEVFIRCTIGGAGDLAENRRAEANSHLATIAHMHALEVLAEQGMPYAPASMVLDIPREKVVKGAVNMKQRVANIQAVCGIIAAVWPTI